MKKVLAFDCRTWFTIVILYFKKYFRKLTRNYLPKKKEEDDYQFTATKAFKLMLNEINDLAGQHEVVAENLSTAVVSDLTSLVKSMKDDRRKVGANM